MDFTRKDLTKIAAEIQNTLTEADRVVFRWEERGADSEDKKVVRFLLEKAFAQTMLLLDAAGLHNTLAVVQRLNEEAKKDYCETDYYEDLFLVWTGKLERYIEPFLLGAAPKETEDKAISLIEIICSGFTSAAKVLASRRRKRRPFAIEDEYDVQDLLESLLRIHFSDVRPEEPNPSVSGQSTRVDFLLKQERLIVEAKMAKNKYRDSQIGDDLIRDVVRYEARHDYDTLVCFIYDPTFLIKNPVGLAADVQSQQSRLAVNVFYGPSRGRTLRRAR